MTTEIKHRFVVLDSWRGICACLVALFHFVANSHIYDVAFFRGAWLFVDFFFVLSGFVIFANYEEKLKSGFGLGRFLLLRFGRLYPLHFTILMIFISVDLAQIILPSLLQYAAFRPFSAPGETPFYVLSNFMLTQALGLHDRLSFNGPSWSISTEFYTYVFFALALIVMKNKILWLIGILLFLCPVFLAVFSPNYMDTTFKYGFIRCLFGFSAGGFVWQIYRIYGKQVVQKFKSTQFWDTLEIIIVILIIAFVAMAGVTAFTLAAPVIFSMAIFVFAMERGRVSQCLKIPPFFLLGTLSYSIYMNHALISGKLFFGGARFLKSEFGLIVTSMVEGRERIGVSPWYGDLLSVLYIAVLIAVSYLTYRLIEKPCNSYFRKLGNKPAKIDEGVEAFGETSMARETR
ncbi:MAG: acyltransferase family protein [Micavibrio sp.]